MSPPPSFFEDSSILFFIFKLSSITLFLKISLSTKLILQPSNCICNISRKFCVYQRGQTLKTRKQKLPLACSFSVILWHANKTPNIGSNMGIQNHFSIKNKRSPLLLVFKNLDEKYVFIFTWPKNKSKSWIGYHLSFRLKSRTERIKL